MDLLSSNHKGKMIKKVFCEEGCICNAAAYIPILNKKVYTLYIGIQSTTDIFSPINSK